MVNWKDKGFTQIPNIVINNPAVPRCVRSTYEAISARAFGKRVSVSVSQETLAKDVGVSRRTWKFFWASFALPFWLFCFSVPTSLNITKYTYCYIIIINRYCLSILELFLNIIVLLIPLGHCLTS